MDLQSGSTIELALGPTRVLAIADGWVLVQRPGQRPLVFSEAELRMHVQWVERFTARMKALGA